MMGLKLRTLVFESEVDAREYDARMLALLNKVTVAARCRDDDKLKPFRDVTPEERAALYQEFLESEVDEIPDWIFNGGPGAVN